MFWRSVVGKLVITILLLVSFVLFILTILLLQFFESFHIQEAEKTMMQSASKIALLIEEHDDKSTIMEMTNVVKDSSTRVVVYHKDGSMWESQTSNDKLVNLGNLLPDKDSDLQKVISAHKNVTKQTEIEDETEVIVVATPVENKEIGVVVYQTLDVVNQTRAQTTKLIFVAAGIAIILTIIFAVFLSTRITAPLIKMREAAFDLARGEFNTKVPILTHDEIGELAIAFNRMGRQLKFHINALNQEKEQLSSIVNSMADGVITLNRHGDMIVTNPPSEQFIQDLYFEKNINTDLDNQQLPDVLDELLQKVIRGEKEAIYEISLQGRDWVMIMTPLYDKTFVRGAVAVMRDMTEERQLDKLRTDFIANVSHELRTPIALMQGYSEAIVDDIADSKEEKNELAQIIHDESLRMSRLVNELLDIGRMEAGHIELHKQEIDIKPFIEKIYRKFIGISEEQKITLELIEKIKDPIAIFDADRIEQVFTNLIDNAISHTDEGGLINVKVTNTSEHLHVEIEDNGSGIPKEDLSFIFERFYKADKSRTRTDKKKGTGLGLAITKHIVSAHQGTISVKSKEGIGTTFSFKIPKIDSSNN
ncbi:MAG TPA: ATP-binding protein [Pseudogracilibacillus sp.]|nr:ATP-binding protein [Pseudogracilibacillus sp.]